MKKTALKTAAALSTVMLLAACPNGDDDSSKNTNTVTNTAAKSEAGEPQPSLTERYLLALELPTSRNGQDFNVSVDAYCNKIEKDDGYEAACTKAAQDYVDTKFGCSRFPLAPGGTKIDNQEVLARGLQGNYKEFPTQYLFTDEELEAAVEADQKHFNKDNFFVITDVSDLDAAAESFPQGVPNPGPQCE